MSKNNKKKEKMAPRAIIKIVILISIVVLIVLIPFIYSGVTYITAWNNNLVTPYAKTVTKNDDGTETTTDKISGVELDNVKRMDGKDFNLFTITFEATYYNDRADEKGTDIQTVKFSLKVTKNENSPEGLKTISSSSTYYFKAGVALCSNWIKLDSYSTSLTSFALDSAKTLTVKCPNQFPAKASTWPIPVTVESPDCYLYFYYLTQENGKEVKNSYILKYTYQEYMTSTTEGGIRK